MHDDTYLVQILNTSFAVVVVCDYHWLLLLSVAHSRLAVIGAKEQHILPTFGYIRHRCVRLGKSKEGGQECSMLYLQQLWGKLWLVPANCTDQGHPPL